MALLHEQIFTPRFHICFKNECVSFMRQSKLTSLLDFVVNIYKIIHVYSRCQAIIQPKNMCCNVCHFINMEFRNISLWIVH